MKSESVNSITSRGAGWRVLLQHVPQVPAAQGEQPASPGDLASPGGPATLGGLGCWQCPRSLALQPGQGRTAAHRALGRQSHGAGSPEPPPTAPGWSRTVSAGIQPVPTPCTHGHQARRHLNCCLSCCLSCCLLLLWLSWLLLQLPPCGPHHMAPVTWQQLQLHVGWL